MIDRMVNLNDGVCFKCQGMETQQPCIHCDGRGSHWGSDCEACFATGIVTLRFSFEGAWIARNIDSPIGVSRAMVSEVTLLPHFLRSIQSHVHVETQNTNLG